LLIVRATNPWAQEAPGSNPGAPTTNSLNYLRLFPRGIFTAIQLGNKPPFLHEIECGLFCIVSAEGFPGWPQWPSLRPRSAWRIRPRGPAGEVSFVQPYIADEILRGPVRHLDGVHDAAHGLVVAAEEVDFARQVPVDDLRDAGIEKLRVSMA